VNDMFLFFSLTTDESLPELDSGGTELTELLTEAESAGRDDSELGHMEFDPKVLGSAVELPHHSQLKPEFRGMYVRYNGGACGSQHWGTPETVSMALGLAYNWWKQGFKPTLLIGDLSAKDFSKTGCHAAHKTGTHVDMDLAGTLPRDPGYNRENQLKCAQLCWFAIQLGAKRVLFSDSTVARAVNELAKKNGLPGRVETRSDHDNHFHIEMPR